MKKIAAILAAALLALVMISLTASAYGADLIHPLQRRTHLTQGYSSGHQAYDFRSSHTKVVAVLDGQVDATRWDRPDGWTWPCDNTVSARGNYLILDHGSGLTTSYYHLSNTGNTPGAGASVDRGQYMALTDDTGCSTGDHLHFSVKTNGSPVDPYAGTTEWVSGDPIPAGYINQNGILKGPFPLDRPKIRDKWLALEGRLGSPLNNDYADNIPVPRVSGVERAAAFTFYQHFQRGVIFYTGSGPAQVVEYGDTYLPDVRAYRLENVPGWNSSIAVRNDGSSPADVSVTIYNPDGSVRGARTYTSLPANASWSISVRDVVYDDLLQDWTYSFTGSAVASSLQPISAAVFQEHPGLETWDAYTGIELPQASVHVPTLLKNHYGFNTEIYIQNAGSAPTAPSLHFRPTSGYPGSSCNYTVPIPIPANGHAAIPLDQIGCLGPSFVGSVYVFAGQPLALATAQHVGDSQLLETGSSGGSGQTVYAPLIQNFNFGWVSGVAMQNAAAAPQTLRLRYYKRDTGQLCHFASAFLGGHRTAMYASPPGKGNQQVKCPSILSAKLDGSGYPAAGNINQVLPGSHAATAYPAIASPGQTVTIPRLTKAWSGQSSGLTIQNTQDLYNYITVKFYNAYGQQVGPWHNYELYERGQTWVIFPLPVANGFHGSAEITASVDIAVVVNHLAAGTGDNLMSHIAVHR